MKTLTKKIFLFSFILGVAVIGVSAQNNQSGCTSATTPGNNVVFYGIDYSLVRFSYIAESPAYALRIMPEINRLFITEAKKYDVAKMMKKNVIKTDLDYAKSVTSSLSEDQLVLNSDYKISVDDVKAVIAKYPDSTDEGVGLVFVAELMNKTANEGSYYVTFFDLKTKEVLTTCRQTGKAGGFGMRNFWAASIYSLMKNWR